MILFTRLKQSSTGFKLIISTTPINIIWLLTPYDIPVVIRFINGMMFLVGVAYYLTDNGESMFRKGLEGLD